MKQQLLAALAQEGTRLISTYGRFKMEEKYSKPQKSKEEKESVVPASSPRSSSENLPETEEPQAVTVPEPQTVTVKENKSTNVQTGCIPCSLGHFSTCTGVLNEAMRFARDRGIDDESIDRVSMCLDELNALERVDLRPEMIAGINNDWEKALATRTLNESRAMRHALESISGVDDLEQIAAKTQKVRNEIGREYLSTKLKYAAVSEEVKEKAYEALNQMEQKENEAQ